MRRFVFVGFLTIATVLGSTVVVLAQIPPVDEVTDPIEDTVNQVVDQVEETVDPVDETVDQVEDTVGQTGNAVGETVDDTVQGVGQAAGGGASTSGAGTDGVGQVIGGSGQSSDAAGSSAGGAGGGSAQEQRNQGKARGNRAPHRSSRARSEATQMARLDSQPGSQALAPIAHIPLVVQLKNDADGDEAYRETETAPRPGAEVSFQLRLENAGPHELTILAIRDATPGPLGAESEAVCVGMAGTRLSSGQSAVCRFTLPRVAAPPSERVVAVTEVDVAETADPTTAGTITDTSVVRTSGVGVLGAVARRILGSLASTGAGISLLAAVAAGLAIVGGWTHRFGSRRSQPAGAKRAEILAARPVVRKVRRLSVNPAGHSRARRDGMRVGATDERD